MDEFQEITIAQATYTGRTRMVEEWQYGEGTRWHRDPVPLLEAMGLTITARRTRPQREVTQILSNGHVHTGWEDVD